MFRYEPKKPTEQEILDGKVQISTRKLLELLLQQAEKQDVDKGISLTDFKAAIIAALSE